MESPPVTGFRGGAFDKKVKGFDFFGQTFDFLIWGALTCRFGERRHPRYPRLDHSQSANGSPGPLAKPLPREIRNFLAPSSKLEGSMTMVDTGAHSPGVQRASSATSTSKFDNIGGWVGLEGVTSLPVRCDMHVGRASEGISHQPGWNSSSPTTSPSLFPRPAGR